MTFFATEKRGRTREEDGRIGDGGAPCHGRGSASRHGRRILGFRRARGGAAGAA